MGDVIRLPIRHARASMDGTKPKRAGSASLPEARRVSEKTQKWSGGIFPRAIQLKAAFGDSSPAIKRALSAPPKASTTASMEDNLVITHRDNSRNVSTSSPHAFGLENPCESGTIAAMYSKTQTAKRLVQTQEALGMTNAAISRELGVSSHGWSQYRTGDRTIPHKVIVGLKEKFGVTSDWILAGDPSGLPQRLYALLRVAA